MLTFYRFPVFWLLKKLSDYCEDMTTLPALDFFVLSSTEAQAVLESDTLLLSNPPTLGNKIYSFVLVRFRPLDTKASNKAKVDALASVNMLSLIATDEAHLISEWSAFRPAFSELKELKQTF